MSIRDLSRKRIPFKKLSSNIIIRWFGYLVDWLYAILIPYSIFSLCISWSKVASCSMTPTILTHDIGVVCKYKIKVYDIMSIGTEFLPIIGEMIKSNFFHKFSPLVKKYSWLNLDVITFKNIEIGDIVIFQIPGDESAYTKRVIAGPGDKVQFYYGYYFINDKQLEYTYKGIIETRENNQKITGDMWEEVSTNGKRYNILMSSPMGSHRDISEVFYVPENSYFVSGDNRYNSDDGRSMLSFIHKDQISHHVVFNIFSNANLTTLNLYEWIKSIRREYSLKVV